MKEIKQVKHLFTNVLVLVTLFCLSACEKTRNDLLDPETAGVWTLFNTSNSGLPGNTVKDMQLDNHGNIWIACYGNGLSMYNDSSWKTYNTSNSFILSNMVTSIDTANGNVIIGTTNGISWINAAGEWSSFKDPGVTNMNISTIKVASNGMIWVGTDDIGYYVIIPSGFSHSASGFGVSKFEEDSSGNIWVGYTGGLAKFDGTNWSNITTSDGLPNGGVTALFFDSKKRLWIGLIGEKEGVYWLDNSGIHQLSLMNGTLGNIVSDICEDKNGDIWFTTMLNGLIRYDGVVAHSYKEYNGFYEDAVNCIMKDKDGNMWFGLASKGLVKYSLPLE